MDILEVNQIVTGLVMIATFLTSVAVIWKHLDKIKKTLDLKMEKTIKEIVQDSNIRQDERTSLMLENLKLIFTSEVRGIESRITDYAEKYNKDKEEERAMLQLLKDSLIEAYKNDIRIIYYKLRDTGEISDTDKSYADKIFPKYIAIGGNSDIQAKYEELCRVYERRTQEKYDETFEKTKTRKRATKKKVPDEQINLDDKNKTKEN